jgi:glutamate racemase
VVERFANNVKVLRQPCPGLVQQIEAGELDTDKTKAMLHHWLDPMKQLNIDRLVLGCTHYPFVAETIRGILGEGVQIIDPAPAIARQVKRVSDYENRKENRGGQTRFYTSGNANQFRTILKQLTGWSEIIHQLTWNANKLQS